MKEHVHRLIRLATTYTKTDIAYLLQGTSWLTLGRIVSAASGLILTVVFANALTQHTFGDYKFILSLAGVISGLLLSGMGTAVTRAVAKGYDQILKIAFITHLKWGVLMSLAALLVSGYYHIQENEMMAIALLVIAICMPVIQSATLYSSCLIGKKDFKKDTLFTVLYALIPTSCLLIALFFTKSALVLSIVYFVSTMATSLSLYFFTVTSSTLAKTSSEIKEVIATISYGKHLSLMNILGTISFQLDKVLIYHHFGAIDLAIYTIATAPPQQIRYLNKILGTMVLPKLSTQRLSILRHTLHRKALLLFSGSLVITALYITIAPFVFSLLFPAYTSAVIYSQLFALVILFFPSMLYQQTFTAHMHKRKLYILQTVIPVLKIFLLLIFLPYYGIWAAIGTILCVEFVRLISVLYLFKKIPNTENASS